MVTEERNFWDHENERLLWKEIVLDSILEDDEKLEQLSDLDLITRLHKQEIPENVDGGPSYEELTRVIFSDRPTLQRYAKNVDKLHKKGKSRSLAKDIFFDQPLLIGIDPNNYSEFAMVRSHYYAIQDLESKDIKSYNRIKEKVVNSFYRSQGFTSHILRKKKFKEPKERRREFYLGLVRDGIKEEFQNAESLTSYAAIGIASLLMVCQDAVERGDETILQLAYEELGSHKHYATSGGAIDRLNSIWLHFSTGAYENASQFSRKLIEFWDKPGYEDLAQKLKNETPSWILKTLTQLDTNWEELIESKPLKVSVWEKLRSDSCWTSDQWARQRKQSPWNQAYINEIYFFGNKLELNEINRVKYEPTIKLPPK